MPQEGLSMSESESYSSCVFFPWHGARNTVVVCWNRLGLSRSCIALQWPEQSSLPSFIKLTSMVDDGGIYFDVCLSRLEKWWAESKVIAAVVSLLFWNFCVILQRLVQEPKTCWQQARFQSENKCLFLLPPQLSLLGLCCATYSLIIGFKKFRERVWLGSNLEGYGFLTSDNLSAFLLCALFCPEIFQVQ